MVGQQGFRAAIIVPPGCGKDMIFQRIVSKYETPVISTGKLLRQHIRERTLLGMRADRYLRRGKCIPDYLFTQMLRKPLERLGSQGLILDGYPRTVGQAKELEKKVALDFVLLLEVPAASILAELKKRHMAKQGGTLTYSRAQRSGIALTPSELQVRAEAARMSARQADFGVQMEPVIRHFAQQKLIHHVPVPSLNFLWHQVERHLNLLWPKTKSVDRLRRHWYFGLCNSAAAWYLVLKFKNMCDS